MATPLQNTLSRTLMNGNLTINGNISVNSTRIALGFQAGNTNQGLNSVAIGSYAGNTNQGAQSVAIGYLSAYNQTGINNTFVGQGAGGTYLATGASNTFIGSATVAVEAAGSNNTTLGAGATVSTSYGNTTAIGVGATATASNQIVLGTTNETLVSRGTTNLGRGFNYSAIADNRLNFNGGQFIKTLGWLVCPVTYGYTDYGITDNCAGMVMFTVSNKSSPGKNAFWFGIYSKGNGFGLSLTGINSNSQNMSSWSVVVSGDNIVVSADSGCRCCMTVIGGC